MQFGSVWFDFEKLIQNPIKPAVFTKRTSKHIQKYSILRFLDFFYQFADFISIGLNLIPYLRYVLIIYNLFNHQSYYKFIYE
jgi:hypothetical protein